MNDIRPTVSVIMATYNGEKYIREQLDSILAQTYPIYELIIQDDCSTDHTANICREYEANYPCVHFYENDHNLGFNLNFKSAAMRATGDYVAFSDQDDVWFKDKIERQVAAIGGHDICFSAHVRGVDMQHTHVVSPQYSLEALLFAGFAGHTMLLRSDFVHNEDNWSKYIIYDWGLAISAQLNRGIIFIDTPLNWHRSNDDSAMTVLTKKNSKGISSRPSYQPYLYGLRNFRKLQRQDNFIGLYKDIFNKTERRDDLRTAHIMSALMLDKSLYGLFKLCLLCMRNCKIIYPKKGEKGIRGILHGFFYPFIYSYNNYEYQMVNKDD